MIDKVIIGSSAIKHYFADFKREPKDLDYAVIDSSKYKSTRAVECLENSIILKDAHGTVVRPAQKTITVYE